MNKRINEIAKELQSIDEGDTSMLNGNETVVDRLILLAYELLNIIGNIERNK